MDFNLITNVKTCFDAVQGNPPLLYYSHIPTAIIAVLVGLFVFYKSRSLVGGLLLMIGISFSLWSMLDLIVWTSYNSNHIMLAWSLLGILSALIFIFSVYFAYVFINKKDISFAKKILGFLLLLPIMLTTPTRFNLILFDVANCESTEGRYFTDYYYLLGLAMFFLILIIAFLGYRKAEKENRKGIVFFTIGVELFLFAFFIAGYLSSKLDNFNMEQFGLFGMTFFMAMLAFVIVKYKAFSIKLIGAQALIVSLIILVGSQFFFAQNMTATVLTAVTLVLVGGIGIVLIRSVKNEVERKEQLQTMADKLAMANDELRKLDNAKTEFLSIASHQLRTPLTAIKGFVSLLLEGSYGEMKQEQKDALEKVYSSSERLIQLVEDLLNVSRIESGRMQFALTKSNMGDLLKELYENFLLVAKTKQFYLDLKFPKEGLSEISFDYSKVRELISNFIDNALKYTEKGGVTVTAEMRDSGVVVDASGFVIAGQKAAFGPVVRVTVSDTGIGVPKEEIPYLFKKFSRGKDVSRLHVGGTGLGLYVGKAIADAHHGAVWVESDGAGMGSRFIIELPVNQE